MQVYLSIIFLTLFVISLCFQIRDIRLKRKFNKSNNSITGCEFKKKYTNKRYYTITICRNFFYNKLFKDNFDKCPDNCKGRIYPDKNVNYELMLHTDKLYLLKECLYLSCSILGIISSFLNIIQKI